MRAPRAGWGMENRTGTGGPGCFALELGVRYLLSQRGQDAVSFCPRTSFILAPQDGQTKTVDAPDRRFIFSNDQRLYAGMAEVNGAITGSSFQSGCVDHARAAGIENPFCDTNHFSNTGRELSQRKKSLAAF